MQCKLNINNFLDIKSRLFANMYQIKKYVLESLPTRAVILSSAVMPPPRHGRHSLLSEFPIICPKIISTDLEGKTAS